MRSKSFDSEKTGILDEIMWRMRTHQIQKRLPKNKLDKVADFGCGKTAPFLRKLLKTNKIKKAIGVDLDPDFSFSNENLKLIKEDLNKKLPIQDAELDVVLSLATLEHLDSYMLHLKEINRVLKKGGRLILTTPSPLGKPVLEFLAYRLKIIDKREIEDHRRYFNSKMLKESLQKAGFKSLNITTGTFQLGMNNIVLAIK